ncbi:hypothetical protein GCM10025776_23410 [Corallincola platygyrae]
MIAMSVVLFSCVTNIQAAQVNKTMLVGLGTSLTKNGGWLEELAGDGQTCGGFKVLNAGGAGENSDWGTTKVEELVVLKPDYLFIEFAANDASLLHGVSHSKSVQNVSYIIDKFRQESQSTKIVLLALNPMSGPKGWTRPRLNTFYDSHLALADEQNVRVLDVRPFWAELTSDQIKHFIPDGVHPTVEANKKILVPNIRDFLLSIC